MNFDKMEPGEEQGRHSRILYLVKWTSGLEISLCGEIWATSACSRV